MNMVATLIVISAALVGAALIMAYPWLHRQLRERNPLAPAERTLLLDLLPWRALLSEEQRERLAKLSAQLLADVRFVGCNGLEIDPVIRHAVAAQASLLCLGAQRAVFGLPREILVYPDAFYIPRTVPDDQGLVDEAPMLASGEAWQTGRVILSWADIEDALAGAEHNVVLHEFAHLLDFAAPEGEGAPPLAETDSWTQAFGEAFDRLREAGSPVLDVYGAENPTEFFAVAVEAFFQRGAALAEAHPGLYAVMHAYFDIDTAARAPEFLQIGAR